MVGNMRIHPACTTQPRNGKWAREAALTPDLQCTAAGAQKDGGWRVTQAIRRETARNRCDV